MIPSGTNLPRVLFHWYCASEARLLFAAAQRAAEFDRITRTLGGRYPRIPTPIGIDRDWDGHWGLSPLAMCQLGLNPFCHLAPTRRPPTSVSAHYPASCGQKRSFRHVLVDGTPLSAHSLRSCVRFRMFRPHGTCRWPLGLVPFGQNGTKLPRSFVPHCWLLISASSAPSRSSRAFPRQGEQLGLHIGWTHHLPSASCAVVYAWVVCKYF